MNFVQLQAQRHGIGAQDFASSFPRRSRCPISASCLNEVKTKGVVRIKAWSPNGTVLYSDDKTEIGQRFTNDDELTDTLRTGKQNIEITKPTKTENAGKSNFPSCSKSTFPSPNRATPSAPSKPITT